MVIAFLLAALCCSLSAGNSLARDRRHVETVKYTYYKGGNSGGFSGSVEEKKMYSKDQAKMFSFLFQGIVCLYNSVRNWPADKKPAAYKFIVENSISFVETTASSCGLSVQQLFLNQNDFNIYLELRKIAQIGNYENIRHVERTCDGLFAGLGGALGGVLHGLGLAAGDIGLCLTGILGGIAGLAGGLLGGILNAAGGLVGGAEHLVTGILGGAANLAGGIAGGLGGALGGLVKGVSNIGGVSTGGHSGGLLGGHSGGFLGL
ncbi:hypothetical protein NDU88_004967 [Pleurodeles waltl]|uniref:Uncharacterized protein n=2 Tax=Pleurodeles waltl TaxID=8319 RepID=A0AAV7PMD0_PLEWA|nr:hypothetical protein NDU88_004967 [Pleurodeles waltl]